MVNFRFHIVSLTAVLLALGIGLVLGTTFLDDATVNQLESQLDGLEANLDEARARNDQQQERLGQFEDEAAQLDEHLCERLCSGELEDDPVLLIATEGVDGAWADSVLRTLGQADADTLGVWWLSDRLVLDDDEEVADLAAALEFDTDVTERLMDNLVGGLADVLFGATDVVAEQAAGGAAVETEEPAEPPLLARLREAGFVTYQIPEGQDGEIIALPSSGLRVVVLDGPDGAVPATDVLVPMLADLTDDGPAPVVATQPTVATGDDIDPDSQPRLVGALRDDDTLVDRVSTVDNLDDVAGRVATLLATVDAVPGAPVIGSYGTADGADDWLPPAPGDG
jgi:hypothetical protein